MKKKIILFVLILSLSGCACFKQQGATFTKPDAIIYISFVANAAAIFFLTR